MQLPPPAHTKAAQIGRAPRIFKEKSESLPHNTGQNEAEARMAEEVERHEHDVPHALSPSAPSPPAQMSNRKQSVAANS